MNHNHDHIDLTGLPSSLLSWIEMQRFTTSLDDEHEREREARIASAVEEHWRRMETDSDYRAEVEQEFAEERAADRDHRIGVLAACGVPQRHARLIVYGELSRTDALQVVRPCPEMLVMAGPVGVGKTLAAGQACYDLCPPSRLERRRDGWQPLARDRDPLPRLITAPDLSRTSAYDEKAMAHLERCPLLVIDDVGGEFADQRGYFVSLLDSLANKRYASERPLIITTNLTRQSFEARYGVRIVDRVAECGRWVNLSGKSLRRNA